jgi:pre-mRNA-splicing factor SYF1
VCVLQKDICLKYADLEKRLGEIDRARAIYMHTSQYCNPTDDSDFWKKWNDFEVMIATALTCLVHDSSVLLISSGPLTPPFVPHRRHLQVRHGNEDTFREMLRVKRSVQATFNTQVNLMSASMLAQQKKDEDADRLRRLAQDDEMARLESQVLEEQRKEQQERKMTAAPGVGSISFTAAREEPVQVEANPDEIELGDDEEEEDEEEKGEGAEEGGAESAAAAKARGKSVKIEEVAVPEALFGGLKAQAAKEAAQQEAEPKGALARLRQAGRGQG